MAVKKLPSTNTGEEGRNNGFDQHAEGSPGPLYFQMEAPGPGEGNKLIGQNRSRDCPSRPQGSTGGTPGCRATGPCTLFFRRFFGGGHSDFKLWDNTKFKAKRVKAFLQYMAQGYLGLQMWLFPDNVNWIQMWQVGLTRAGKSPLSLFTLSTSNDSWGISWRPFRRHAASPKDSRDG